MFLKNRNISSKIKRSKVADYAALRANNIDSDEKLHYVESLFSSGSTLFDKVLIHMVSSYKKG